MAMVGWAAAIVLRIKARGAIDIEDGIGINVQTSDHINYYPST